MALTFAALASAALAQITGEIRGSVSDSTSALVPGAKVSLISIETGEKREFLSDKEGRFAFGLLKIGDYQIVVEAEGFRKASTQANVRSSEITGVAIKLEVGQVTEQVTVTDAIAVLDTQSAQVQESYDSKRTAEIPVGRNPNVLATTLPGIVPNPSGFNSGSFITNGNRARANNITIDNITATDISTAGTGSTNNGPLNFSSIKEVKIITNNMSAEFGRNSGAQVQYITKSGTNEFHGEVYEYFRNDKLNARDVFDRSGSAPITRHNQFGGVLGGPIVRNKTHFFLSSEITPIRGAGGTRVAQVPTASMLAGVTDATSRRLLEQYKLPAAETDSGTFGNVQQSAPSPTDFYQYSARFDHQFSGKDTIYGRYGRAQNDGTSANNTFVGTNLANFGLISTNSVYSANINETHVFTNTLINELRAGFGRTSPIFDLNTTVPLGPRISFANGQIATFGQSDIAPQGRIQNTYQIGDTISWYKGRHNIRAGGDFFRYQGNSFFEQQVRGAYIFLNWDDFAAGRPNSYTQRFGGTVRGHRTWIASGFFQDDYRLTPHFTLNLGLRFETFGAVTEVNKLTSTLNFGCRDSLGAAGSGNLGCFNVGDQAVRTNYYTQPRFGFAWNPGGGKTVIRGGYGLVADFNFLNPITNQRALPPFVVAANITGTANFSGGNSWSNLVGGTADIQRQSSSLIGRVRNDVLNYGDINPVIDIGLRNPQVHQWSFGMQRQLPERVVLKVAYTGTKGNYLQRARQLNLNSNVPRAATDLNDELARSSEFVNSLAAMTGSPVRFSTRVDPRFNIVNYYDSSANSNFHALEVLATRPFDHGLSLHVGYTYGKSIDDVSDALTTISNDSTLIQNPLNLRENRAVSGFDLRQRLVITHVWELPWGKTISNPVLKQIAYGWGFSGISSFRTGFPVSFDAGPRLGVATISTITTGGVQRPMTAGPFEFNPLPAGSAGAPTGLNNDAVAGRRIATYAQSLGLSQQLLGTFGNLGRNSHRLNGQTDYTWNVYKRFSFAERMNLQVRAEMYNTFNNVSFLDVNRNITNAAFGQYTTAAGNQRIFQLGAVLQF
ncbi:MAG: carboxypeptidase regulatory-like domain-containing protein [Bryobacterales bacterium]|nr:carboxypeptidase regulatory-like domain-containing protein [Bryobacterales bacterium]